MLRGVIIINITYCLNTHNVTHMLCNMEVLCYKKIDPDQGGMECALGR